MLDSVIKSEIVHVSASGGVYVVEAVKEEIVVYWVYYHGARKGLEQDGIGSPCKVADCMSLQEALHYCEGVETFRFIPVPTVEEQEADPDLFVRCREGA